MNLRKHGALEDVQLLRLSVRAGESHRVKGESEKEKDSEREGESERERERERERE